MVLTALRMVSQKSISPLDFSKGRPLVTIDNPMSKKKIIFYTISFAVFAAMFGYYLYNLYLLRR